MHKHTTLNSSKLILASLFLLLNLSSLYANEKCDFYNQQFDKYQRLADAAPSASKIKLEYIKKVDYYDMMIFADEKCELYKMKDVKQQDELFNALFNDLINN